MLVNPAVPRILPLCNAILILDMNSVVINIYCEISAHILYYLTFSMALSGGHI